MTLKKLSSLIDSRKMYNECTFFFKLVAIASAIIIIMVLRNF